MGFDLFPRIYRWTIFSRRTRNGGGGGSSGSRSSEKVLQNVFFPKEYCINYLKGQVVLTQGVEADKLEALRQDVQRLVRLRKIKLPVPYISSCSSILAHEKTVKVPIFNVADRDPGLFSPLDPGSWTGIFRILDPKPYFWEPVTIFWVLSTI